MRDALIIFCCLILNGSLSQSVYAQQLNAEADYRAALGEKRTVDVDFAAIVTAPYRTKLLKIWMPLPQSDAAQKITIRTFSTFPDEIKPTISREKKFGNQFAYFEIPNPQGAQIIHQKFRVTVSELTWHLDPHKVQAVSNWPASFAPYLQQSDEVAQNADFNRLLNKLRSNLKVSPHRQEPNLFTAMQWIDKHVSYDHVNASLQADPLHAITQKQGHCSDYHGLCSALGRSLGTPTRVTYGLQLFPKSSPSHCKVEAYLSPYGWVSFDLSETQKLALKIKKSHRTDKRELIEKLQARLKQGYRENSWLLVTRGTNYELAPPASTPAKVVRTIYAEADGVPLLEPDPANISQKKFAWMTAHKFSSAKPLEAVFKSIEHLKAYQSSSTRKN